MHVPTLLHLIRQIRVRIIYFVMDIRITGLRIIIYLEKRKKIWTRDNLKSDIQNTEYLRDINKETYDKSSKRCYDNDPVTGESRMYYNRFGSYELMYNVKPADTIMYKAIDNNIIDYINNIDGVEDVSYGYY